MADPTVDQEESEALQHYRPFGEKRAAFLARLERYGSVKGACRKLRMSKSTVYNHRAQDPEFAKAMDEAVDAGVARAEEEAFRRGIEGGSDRMLEFVLKSRHPDYRPRTELGGIGGGPIAVNAQPDLSAYTTEELEQMREIQRRARERAKASDGGSGDPEPRSD